MSNYVIDNDMMFQFQVVFHFGGFLNGLKYGIHVKKKSFKNVLACEEKLFRCELKDVHT